jgi:HD-GYP domain-containing protein (c-di-GMP phosphodiesterase class II)
VRTLLSGTILACTAFLALRDRRARQRVERLAAASLESLLAAIDANDADTGAHVRRVASYAIVIGSAAGSSQRQLRAIERVALFHDIGKIHEALFDIVHDEDDQLSTEERERIATHPRRGADVLEPLSVFYPELAEGVLSHHERWDGSGYPRGLRGEEIPFSARVVAIADSYDAITTRRNYRAAGSRSEARHAITSGRGTQFDPRLVDIFLRSGVQRALRDAQRTMREPGQQKGGRRGAVERKRAPDVTFRWRDGFAAPPPQDPEHREAP